MSSTHCRGCAGFASAGASTCRFGPGSVQTVDTDTATYRTAVVPDDPAAGGPITTDVSAVSSADSDTPVSRARPRDVTPPVSRGCAARDRCLRDQSFGGRSYRDADRGVTVFPPH